MQITSVAIPVANALGNMLEDIRRLEAEAADLDKLIEAELLEQQCLAVDIDLRELEAKMTLQSRFRDTISRDAFDGTPEYQMLVDAHVAEVLTEEETRFVELSGFKGFKVAVAANGDKFPEGQFKPRRKSQEQLVDRLYQQIDDLKSDITTLETSGVDVVYVKWGSL